MPWGVERAQNEALLLAACRALSSVPSIPCAAVAIAGGWIPVRAGSRWAWWQALRSCAVPFSGLAAEFDGPPKSERHFSLSTKASLLWRFSPTRKIISRNGFRDRSDASIEIETDPSGSFTRKRVSIS